MFFLLIAANGALSAIAQTREISQPETMRMRPVAYNADSMLPKWAIDVNLLGGALNQNFTSVNTSGLYPNALTNRTGTLKFDKGMSFGINAQLGWFFDRKSHFGISTGFMYLMQRGNATLSDYKVEYKATDGNGDYRQVVTANGPIKDELEITNLNIPLMLKYKARFSKHWGFTADAGVLFNVYMKNKIKTNASFDYEAIVRHVTAADGSVYTVYDNSPTPNNTDLIITKAQYSRTNPDKSLADYFSYQRSLGYNVGLGVRPNNSTTTVEYDRGSVGFMVQPSLSYYLSDNVSLNLGAYYMYQSFIRSVGNGVRITDRLGDYSSSVANVSSMEAHSYGGSLGLRILFGKLRDRDRDGIPDRRDKCPTVFGVAMFNGCPDRDNDGVRDEEDQCPDVFGVSMFRGCPDSDADGIPDDKDACPFQPGPAKFNGCPDTDNDGVSDADDKCPTQAGPASNNGCPPPVVDTPKRPIIDKPEHDMSEPILFDLGKTKIKDVSVPILMEAVMELSNNENAFIIIDGHTDNTGGDRINDALSFRRANAVKKYLTDMGGNPKKMIAVGHGSRQPIAPNSTYDGRAQNRRVIMSLKHRPKQP